MHCLLCIVLKRCFFRVQTSSMTCELLLLAQTPCAATEPTSTQWKGEMNVAPISISHRLDGTTEAVVCSVQHSPILLSHSIPFVCHFMRFLLMKTEQRQMTYSFLLLRLVAAPALRRSVGICTLQVALSTRLDTNLLLWADFIISHSISLFINNNFSQFPFEIIMLLRWCARPPPAHRNPVARNANCHRSHFNRDWFAEVRARDMSWNKFVSYSRQICSIWQCHIWRRHRTTHHRIHFNLIYLFIFANEFFFGLSFSIARGESLGFIQ